MRGIRYWLVKAGVWELVAVLICAVTLVALAVGYCFHPSQIKNSGKIVEEAVSAVPINEAGELTRSEVIQVVYNTLYALHGMGYPYKSTGEKEIIQYAIKHGILEGMGDGNELNLQDQASRQDAFAFISRGLGLENRVQAKALEGFRDSVEVKDWAVPPVSQMLTLGYLNISGRYIRPGDPITLDELADVLTNIVIDKTAYMNFWEYCTQSWFSIMCGVIAGVSGTVALFLPVWNALASRLVERVVYIVGLKGTGTATLANNLGGRSVHKPKVRRTDPDTVTAYWGDRKSTVHLTHIGSDNTRLFSFMSHKPGKLFRAEEFVLLIVLSHTDSNQVSGIHENEKRYVAQQLANIKQAVVPAVLALRNTPAKALLFINKTDVLSSYENPREDVFKEHIQALNALAENGQVEVCVIEGSALTGQGLDEVQDRILK